MSVPRDLSVSLVLPVYNEEAVLPALSSRLEALLARLDPGRSWEVLFVDDGSSDRSRELIGHLCEQDPRYKVIGFSRNFGHQIAISAGIDAANGEAVVVMDADLQDPPEVVEAMLEKYREGFDVVYAVRKRRHGESWFKRATAALFYRVLKAVVGVSIPADAGDFRLMSRRTVLALRGLREANRFVRGMVAWVGFRQTAIHYERQARVAGETHYPLRKMLRFATDGLVSFSTLPLRIATLLGVLSGLIAAGVAVWVVYVVVTGAPAVPGWATLMLGISLASSAQLLMTGILGEYLGRVYDEVKRRPLYLVDETINLPTRALAIRHGHPASESEPPKDSARGAARVAEKRPRPEGRTERSVDEPEKTPPP